MPRLAGSLPRYPARALFAWYIGLLVFGGLTLRLPFCQSESVPVGLLDCVFTATSACCVTGLTVVSTGNDYSFIGQVVIAVLIQLGGIGIMTITTFITNVWTGEESLRHKLTVAETLGARMMDDVRSILANVIAITFALEALGALLLFVRFAFDQPLGVACWSAIFHSISAFNNAGFGLRDDNLVAYQGDPLVNLTIAALIIVGGIGYPVILDVLHQCRDTSKSLSPWMRLQLHSKLALIGTAALIVGGMVFFWLLELPNTLGQMSWSRGFLVAFFQSVTTRTAGFNTVDIGKLNDATLCVMILLMMIGACPCSTGGGFKVSTLSVLALQAWAKFRGEPRVVAFRRTIAPEMVAKAIATAMIFAIIAVIGLMALLIATETLLHHDTEDLFVKTLFETVSALGTVGLSTGITPHVGAIGKIVLITLMFVGRVGPISMFLALSRPVREKPLAYPKEDVLIG